MVNPAGGPGTAYAPGNMSQIDESSMYNQLFDKVGSAKAETESDEWDRLPQFGPGNEFLGGVIGHPGAEAS